MATVDSGAPPPKELIMAWRAQKWNALPDAGGLLDQDHALMNRMTVLSNIYDALSAFRDRYSGAEINNMPDSVRRIIAGLKKDGLI